MGIEAIGSAVGSVASGVGRGAASLGRIAGEVPSAGVASVSGPIGGILSSIGPKLEGPLSPIINEGPVGLAEFKNTMPIKTSVFNPRGEIVFKAQPELNAVDAVAEAESILAQAKKPEPNGIFPVPAWKVIVPKVTPMIAPLTVPDILEYRKIQPVISPALKPAIKTESRVSAGVSQATLTQPAIKDQEEKQEVEQVQTDSEEAVKTQDEEQIERIKLGLVEDTPKTQVREAELNQAVELAAIEAQVLGVDGIEGWRIVNKLIPQHPGNRSETLNEEDPQNTIPDGSWESAKADIKIRKFASLGEAKKATAAINREYRPEKRGDGDDITDDITEEEHQRVHKDHNHSSKKPLQILERRIVKKSKQPLGVNTIPPLGWTEGWTEAGQEAKAETKLEDLGLAEVFQKAF